MPQITSQGQPVDDITTKIWGKYQDCVGYCGLYYASEDCDPFGKPHSGALPAPPWMQTNKEARLRAGDIYRYHERKAELWQRLKKRTTLPHKMRSITSSGDSTSTLRTFLKRIFTLPIGL